ncbi:MAG: hypothetical protein WD971_03350 [Pirellulales bacterium]
MSDIRANNNRCGAREMAAVDPPWDGFLDKLSLSKGSNGASCNTAVEKCGVCGNLRDRKMADPGPLLMGRALDGGHIFRNAIDGVVSLPYI